MWQEGSLAVVGQTELAGVAVVTVAEEEVLAVWATLVVEAMVRAAKAEAEVVRAVN